MRRKQQVPPVPAAAATVLIDPSIAFQPWQGWGTSLAWWAKAVGGFPEPIRSEYLEKAFDPVKGLGLNVVRYNIGGGENPLHQPPNPEFMVYRTNVPGYEPSPGVWDWTADANQRYVLQQSVRYGADQLEAFSNSPPWWMTVSGTRDRGCSGRGQPAARPATRRRELRAHYLATVVAHFDGTDWHVRFRTLEPLNEPTNGWSYGGGHTHQEGCVVRRAHQNAVVKATIAALRQQGLRETSVTASDETSIVSSLRTFPYYNAPGARRAVEDQHAQLRRRRPNSAFRPGARGAGKDLWLSEYGDGDPSGLTMSRRILGRPSTGCTRRRGSIGRSWIRLAAGAF